MKNKVNLLSVLLLLSIGIIYLSASDDDSCSCKVTSHTYFAVRPQFLIGSPEYLALNRYHRRDARMCGAGFSIQAVPFGGRSTNEDDLARFFMPFCSPSAVVDGTISTDNDNTLLTQNFNLFSVQPSSIVQELEPLFPTVDTPFRSRITLQPRQSVAGLGLQAQYQFCIGCWENPFWISVSGPVMRVRNKIGLEEDVLTTGSFFTIVPIPGEETNLNKELRTMEQALAQSCWEFGRITNATQKKTELAFIQIQVGHVWVDDACCHLEPYIGITIPTGNKPKGKVLFEPVVGNGDHFGFLWGGAGGYHLWENCYGDMHIDAECEVVMQYLLGKTQKRFMDLKGRPWTRYIEMYANQAQVTQALNLGLANDIPNATFLSTPGINILTRDVKVKPGFNFTANMALAFDMCPCDNGFNAEVGYNFFARQAECLKLKEALEPEAAIKDSFGTGITNPVRDITGNQLLNEASFLNLMANDNLTPNGIQARYQNSLLTENDLDLASASHPAMLAHTVYGALGYHWDGCNVPVLLSLGASYQFSREINTVLNQWLVWGKLSVSF